MTQHILLSLLLIGFSDLILLCATGPSVRETKRYFFGGAFSYQVLCTLLHGFSSDVSVSFSHPGAVIYNGAYALRSADESLSSNQAPHSEATLKPPANRLSSVASDYLLRTSSTVQSFRT